MHTLNQGVRPMKITACPQYWALWVDTVDCSLLMARVRNVVSFILATAIAALTIKHIIGG